MSRRRGVKLMSLLYGMGVLLVGIVLGSLAVRGFRQLPVPEDWPVPGGNPERGRLAIRRHGCGACHVVPGVPGAQGRVGPQLRSLREQTYIAGRLPNVPPNLILWIRNAQAVDPQNVMPDLPVTEAEARDIVAYLYRQE